ncbi:MAG: alpha/beta hydrolase [Candidatus Thiodiazotropha lotti]|uniref:alpha/beta fold hydrolase n=1 Tax=Candidatus Thiodiazotropha endoloripes TaxID=1818881 RepID=UPI00083D4230|nr:alpha/beta hydrolase [Candidatus Thiodiazotropha endoloripes]MCG7903298.1 alpha/beta hydrolase [Candidatus Thiodiazotropha weberae]MCG7992852.1 alpha/beta hydrolase [Candidatus Thiodiazotropha lotti]MCG7912432.1 alpha/beta hydrolase [Candidatus Thiodiazotropha weberae]MCG7998917.1 alpha/beta hydrolase [Candidatus Thiodiazotropha lotti]MCW4184514.1 alpha/beta hydrolase [Candidatus Thiodiazotropha weberae]
MNRNRSGNPFKSHKYPLRVRLFFATARTFFGILGRVAPKLTGKLALRLFMTPPRFPARRRESVAEQNSDHQFQQINGQRIAVYRWGEGEPILFSHGWGGRGSHFHALVEIIVEAGYQAVTFDAPAHGQSSGKRTNMLEVTTTLVALAGSLGPLKAVIGHSFGSGIALLAMNRFQIEAEKLILFSCFDDIYWVTDQFGEAFAMNQRVIGAMRDEAQRRYAKLLGKTWQWRDLSPLKTIQTIEHEILLLHDRQDLEVPYHHAENLLAVARQARLHTTNGLGHKKILRDQSCLQTCLEFIQQPLSGIPVTNSRGSTDDQNHQQ